MKDALAKIGFPGSTGHALRRVFVNTLANDPRVSGEAAAPAATPLLQLTVPTKLWGTMLTQRRLRHLVWILFLFSWERNKWGGVIFYNNELACGVLVAQ